MAYEALAARSERSSASTESLDGTPDLVREAMEAAEAAYVHDRDNRLEGIRDLEFLASDQWDARDRRQREADDRPVLTVNRLIGPVKQVSNSIRFSTPSVKVVPTSRDASEGTAWVMAGLVRQIQRQSMATWVYSVATGHAAACGIGHFRVTTGYADDDGFEQEIGIELIPHPFAVLWDPAAQKPDRSDAMHCLVLELIPPAEFERRYPDAEPADFQASSALLPGGSFHWFRPDAVVVAELWRKVPHTRRIGQLADGRVVDLTNVAALPMGMQVVRERTVTSHRVEQSIVSGREVLAGPHEWAGRYIPIVPVLGNEIPLERTVVRHGIVRFARDPQRMYNYWRSQSAEWIGQAAKSPWLVAADQIGPYREMWETANTAPRPFLLYDVLPENPQLKPDRMPSPEPPAALWQEGSIAADEIKATTSIYDASLGNRSNETSGRAISSRQQQSDIANFEFAHNLGISLNHTGRILIDLAPKVYDTSRTLRILDEYEKEHFVPVNQVAYTELGEAVLVHDLSAGRYDMAIRLGPSHHTRREESAEQMVEFLKLNPEAFAAMGDIVAEEMDWPGSAKVAKRLRRMVPPEVLGDDADEPPPPPDPLVVEGAKQEVRETKASADKKEADARKSDAEAQRAVSEAQKAQADARRAEAEAVKAEAEAELARSRAMRERVGAGVDVHEATRPEPKPNGTAQ